MFSYFKYYSFRLINKALKFLIKIGVSSSFIKELVVAGGYGYSSKRMRQKKYNEAFKELSSFVDYDLKLSNSYLRESRYLISFLYYEGYGVEKDIERALSYMELSAKGGHESAIKKLKEIRRE